MFIDMIVQVQDIPVLGVVVGIVSTAAIQSSSAVIAVLQNLASTPAADGIHPLIDIDGALPILFGSNIGTTIRDVRKIIARVLTVAGDKSRAAEGSAARR